MQRPPNRPLAYWLSWALLGAIAMALLCACFWNILPYQALVRQTMKLSDRPLWGFELFDRQIKISLAWLVGAIIWMVVQGLQVGYLILTKSDKAMGVLIAKTLGRQTHAPDRKDSAILRHAKHKYNDAPLRLLSFFSFGCLFAYGLEIVINFNAYPAWDGGMWGLFRALFDWSRFRVDNLVSLFSTLLLVEALVLCGMAVWDLNQLLKETKRSRQAFD